MIENELQIFLELTCLCGQIVIFMWTILYVMEYELFSVRLNLSIMFTFYYY